MNDSILTNTKKTLGVDEAYTAFDPDILMHINTAFATLEQLGIGPEEGFTVEDDEDTWVSFLGTDPRLNPVKSYVYLRVRMLFDPPGTSFHLNALKAQVEQMEWRLNVVHEFDTYPLEEEEV